MKIIFCFFTLLIGSLSIATENKPQNFLFLGGNDPKTFESKINNQIEGVQIVYSWKSLETEKDHYDFSRIERDLTYLSSKGKKLWLQLQDRFFNIKDKSIPIYLQKEEIYQGGLAPQKDNPGEGLNIGHGWVTQQWNPQVRKRFQKLVEEIAKKYDGKIYGINLPETSADINIQTESKKGFSCDKYFEATLENINFLKNSFKKSYVVQYINFWPCEWENDRKYMSRFFKNALNKHIGLGGPDIIPYRKGQMKNAYPFFNQYKGQLSFVAFAVQQPTRTYTNPKTGKKFTNADFLSFGKNFLGVDLIFWSL